MKNQNDRGVMENRILPRFPRQFESLSVLANPGQTGRQLFYLCGRLLDKPLNLISRIDEEIDRVIGKSLYFVTILQDDDFYGLRIATRGRVAAGIDQPFQIGSRYGFISKVPVASPASDKFDELPRLEMGVSIGFRKIRHVHFAMDDRPGFAQRYTVPADIAVVFICLGDDFTIYFAEYAWAPEHTDPAVITSCFID
jgi:hypothetical protein